MKAIIAEHGLIIQGPRPGAAPAPAVDVPAPEPTVQG